ncbi:MAG: hypothetical protein NZ700_04765 [Gemmataceae bacterium]|nr:hypothetical protein [Gemmataceae bacterium]MDW8264055.1 hypothetical protein [Gemmataceae bacterium]
MTDTGRLFWLAAGLFLGVLGTWIVCREPRAFAANDRHGDFILCTGAVAVSPRAPTDGVWLLDYRTGKLLGTVIDRSVGKLVGWAEVDLVQEFGLAARQDVHFLMTTGSISQGQAALYVAETTTGKFGVYTMGPRPDNQPGVLIRRHDLVMFRPAAKGP